MKQRVKFVDAPPPIGGPGDPRSIWMERLRLVAEREGEWAEVYSGTPSAVHQAAGNLRLRQYHIPPGGWEFTVRSFRRGHLALRHEDHVVAVLYARYLGANEPSPSLPSAICNISRNAVWDQHGRRICPMCERTVLPVPGPGEGPYLSMCDDCAYALAPEGVEHGRATTYKKKGCRCPECREAARQQVANRKAAAPA